MASTTVFDANSLQSEIRKLYRPIYFDFFVKYAGKRQRLSSKKDESCLSCDINVEPY